MGGLHPLFLANARSYGWQANYIASSQVDDFFNIQKNSSKAESILTKVGLPPVAPRAKGGTGDRT